MDIATAILAVRKAQDGGHAQVSVSGEDINRITWHDNNPTNITNQQILDKQVELKAEYDAAVTQKATDKANAKAKLIAGEALTEAEADTIVL